jgi:transposase
VSSGLRDVIKTGAPWRWMLNDLPPWAAVYQQAQRWLAAGRCKAMVEDLRSVLHPPGRQRSPALPSSIAGLDTA